MSEVGAPGRGRPPLRSERAFRTVSDAIGAVAGTIAPPLLRIALALPFLRSGLTRWDGFFSLSPSATYLFEEEFKLHVLGAVYDLPAPATLAFVVSSAEIVLPVLLIVGLAVRFAALGLLVMIAGIQLIVPDGWANFHLPWAGLAVALMALGAGPFSADRLIALAIGRRHRGRGKAGMNGRGSSDLSA